MMLSCSHWAGGGDSTTLGYLQPDFRQYLKAQEEAMILDFNYVSLANIELATASYTGTSVYYISWPLMSSTSSVHRWFTRTSVGTFACATIGGTGNNEVSIVDATPLATAGSFAISLNVTGTHSIGDMIYVTAPAFSIGSLTATSKTLILTFTE